jgi:energy-coupling factor transport system permease protein
LLLESHEVMDALPAPLSRTGIAIASSLNLVPAVATSFVEVTEAQRLRGWRPRGPRSWMEVVVPVVLTSVEGSIQLAESMEARGFGSGARTSMASHALQRADWLLVAASALALTVFAVAHAAGSASDWLPYPTLTWPTINPWPVVACLLLFVPVLVWRSRR